MQTAWKAVESRCVIGGYNRVGPFQDGIANPGISAHFCNQIEQVLSRPIGDTETGKYYLVGNSYASGGNVSDYIDTTSRTSVPNSVTIDTSDQAPANNANAVSTEFLTSNGFHIYFTTNAANTQPRAGGSWTVQY